MMKELLDSTQSNMDSAINHVVKELKKLEQVELIQKF